MSEQAEELKEGGGTRKFKFQYGILTDVGRKREENQDSHGHAHTAKASVFIVADGMGGAKGGATASAIAVDTILKSIFTEDGDVTEHSVRVALTAANEIIFEESQGTDDLTGMGTTAVVVAFSGDTVIVGHVGDSRGYRLRDQKLGRLTRDHTLVQELVDSGAIQPAEAQNHPIAHMLTRSLGPTPAVDVDVTTHVADVSLGDTYMLCCDGLYNLVPDSEIETIIADPDLDEAARKLVNVALERGGTDNITVELIRARDLNDASVDFTVPEPGKLRFAASREAPVLRAVKEPAAEPVEKPEAPKAEREKLGKKAKRRAALDSVIFHEHTGEEEEDAPKKSEGPAEEAAAEEPEPTEFEQELRAKAEFDRMKIVGLSVIGVSIGLLSYLFLVRPHVRHTVTQPVTVSATPAPLATASTIVAATPSAAATPAVIVASVVPTPAPTPGPSGDIVDALLSESNTNPKNLIPTLAPTQVSAPSAVQTSEPSVSPGVPIQPRVSLLSELSSEERAALDSAQALKVPQQPKLKADYLGSEVVPIDWNKEQTPKPATTPTVLSSAEKNEIAAKKAGLREDIQEIDIKLSALDSSNSKELTGRANAVGDRVSTLEKVLEKIEEWMRTTEAEFSQWQDRKRFVLQGNSARLAGELGALDPAVEEIRKRLDDLQSEYQSILEQWNRNRQDPELISKTASLSREMKVQKTRLEIAVQEGVDRGLAQNTEDLVQTRLMKHQVERLLQRLHRQIGFLKAAEPNVSGRNAPRLKDLVQERRDAVKQLDDLSVLLPEADERQVLEAQLKLPTP